MISTSSKVIVVDNSGGKIGRCITVIKKSNVKIGYIGDMILLSLIKFISKKKVKKKVIYIGLIIGITYWVYRVDGCYIKCFYNSILLFNKQFKFIGSRVHSIILKEVKSKNIKNKQYNTYFNKIITYSPFII
jgi:large subunit ribosomal protein L14